MKKIIVALIAVAMAAPVAAFAADQSKAVKARSAVESICCGAQSDTIQERIAKLQNEVTNGNAVYTKEELKHISSELEEYQSLQANLLKN